MNISDFLVIQSREMGEMVEGGGVVIIMVRGEDRPVVYDNVTPWSRLCKNVTTPPILLNLYFD